MASRRRVLAWSSVHAMPGMKMLGVYKVLGGELSERLSPGNAAMCTVPDWADSNGRCNTSL